MRKLRVRSQEVRLILGDDAESMRCDESEHVKGEVADEAWCRITRNSGCLTPTAGSTMPVTTTMTQGEVTLLGPVRRADEGMLPTYLEDLVQRSTAHLSEEQTKKVR